MIRLRLFLITLLPWSLFAQTENYDQELVDLLYTKQIEEARSYYNQHKGQIIHSFTIDSYNLISTIYTGNPDSVFSQLPPFIDNYYGNVFGNDLLLFFPNFYADSGNYENGLKMLDIIEAFFKQQQNEKGLTESEKLKNQYVAMSRFPESKIGNPDQELVNLLSGKRIEEAQNYYSQYKEIITHSFPLDFYSLISDIYAGKPNSVFSQLPPFIDNYYENVFQDDILFFLPSFYWDLGEYNNGLKMLDIVEAFFRQQQNEGLENERSLEEIAKLKNRYAAMSRFPKQEINFPDHIEEIHIPIQTEPLILFNAQYNQTILRTVFDTGQTFPFVMKKKDVEKVKVKMIEPYSGQLFNGKKTNLSYGVIDSIRIGSLLIKNVSVLVFEDDFFSQCVPDSIMKNENMLSEFNSVSDQIQIIMGLPIIKMLNYIRFDLRANQLSLFPNRKKGDKPESNMFIESDKLYICTDINDLKFTVFMDTGGNIGNMALLIDSQFYLEHIEQFPAISSKETEILNTCGLTDFDHLVFFKPDILTMRLGKITVDLTEETMILMPESQSSLPVKDGFAGLGLLKKFKRVTFDFNAMRMDCE